jgi:4-alpha-glucanotransferase
VNLEDLWGETEPQNRPGTSTEKPNWLLRAVRRFDTVRNDDAIVGRLEEIDRLRDEAAARERRGHRTRPGRDQEVGRT